MSFDDVNSFDTALVEYQTAQRALRAASDQLTIALQDLTIAHDEEGRHVWEAIDMAWLHAPMSKCLICDAVIENAAISAWNRTS